MKLETLRNLYISQLQDIYSTEKQILASLPKMAKATSNPQLRKGFEKHFDQTKKQVKRLEEIFRSIGVDPRGDTSKPIIGLAAEGEEVLNSKGDADVLDAALIAAAQKIEHYEIASYGTLIAYAKLLGDKPSIKLLKASLDEEKLTDRKLTAIAEGLINRKAVRASGYDEVEEKSGGISLATILLGAAAGVAAGLLLAPSTGQDTRQKLVDGANALWDQWGGRAGNLADAARTKVNDVTDRAKETIKQNAGERSLD